MASRCRFTPVIMRCFEVSSQAHNRACGLKMSVIFSASPLLNECDLVNFFKCRDTSEYLEECGVAKECHSFVMGRALYFRCRSSLDDHLANVIRKIEQFVNRSPAAISSTVAVQTTFPFIECKVRILVGLQAGLDQELVRIVDGFSAVSADQAHKTLCQDAIE